MDPRLHRWLLDAFDVRPLADHDPAWVLEAASIRETVDRAAAMIEQVERFIDPQRT
jgi:hypothetical protein